MASTRHGRVLALGLAACLVLAGCVPADLFRKDGSPRGESPAPEPGPEPAPEAPDPDPDPVPPTPPPSGNPSVASLVVDGTYLVVPEGTSAQFGFRLSVAPAGDVGVSVRLTTADASLTLSGPTDFVFNAANWNASQYVTLGAAIDANAEDGFGSMSLTLYGASPVVVTVVASDKDIPSGQGVRLTVKDTSARGAVGWPVTAVLPLEFGRFQSIDQFRMTDASGSPIPAQIQVLNRWWVRDNSIRHVSVHFDASVAPNGSSYYFFQTSGGPGPQPAQAVSVLSSSSQVTVDTGAVRFVLKKTGFNLFDEVFVDVNGNGAYEASERIIAPGASEGAIFTGRLAGDVQRERDRTDLRWVIEESGPVRAVIRVSGLTSFKGTTDHKHGFAVRIFAYAGKPLVKVDYQLQNSPKDTRFGWPLYFEDVSLNIKPTLSNPTSRLSVVPGTVYQSAPGATGIYLFADSLSQGSVRRSSDNGALATATVRAGYSSHAWADVSDSQKGMAVIIRHMNEMWPNAVEVEADQNVAVRLWPKQSSQFLGGAFSPSGLYWLEDMQQTVKEVLFYFHGPGIAPTTLDNLAANFTWHPIPVVPVSEYKRTSVSLDMDGILPSSTRLPDVDLKQDYWKGSPGNFHWDHDFSRNPSAAVYAYGWLNFEGDSGRKVAGNAGGYPLTGADAFGSENIDRWYRLERQMWGELNVRPEWIAEYDHVQDGPRLELSDHPYFSASWRAYDNNDLVPLAAPRLAGTQFNGWYPRDNQHAWLWDIEEHYLLSANPWVRDWYLFIGQFRQRELRGLDRVGRTDVARAEGEYMANAIHAFRVTGDAGLWEALMLNLKSLAEGRIVKETGTLRVSEAPFQIGFLARAIIDLMVETRGYDHQVYATCWNLLWGFADWNQNVGRFGYYVDGLTGTNTTSTGNSIYIADPIAYFYLQTGRRAHLDLLRTFAESGIGGGEKPFMPLLKWSGDMVGRVTQYAFENPKASETPPSAIANLTASLSGTTVQLQWTAPARAERYHVVWDTVALSPVYTRDTTKRNLWAAKAVGTGLRAAPGTTQSLSFSAASARSGDTVYVAVITFDVLDNMSASSNIAQIRIP